MLWLFLYLWTKIIQDTIHYSSFATWSPSHLLYADYLTWKFEETLELISDKILPMAAPSRTHQKLSWKLTIIVDKLFKNHPCEAYAASFDVRLYDRAKSMKADKDIYTVVQPDLCIVCDLSKLDEHGCLGAPDLVVEILWKQIIHRQIMLHKAAWILIFFNPKVVNISTLLNLPEHNPLVLRSRL